MEYQFLEFENGLRIIHKYKKGIISHCGITVKTGSRDEGKNESGLAHMVEHLIFKGTKKRKTWHINSRIENIGGELNAFTTKEETTVYASFLSGYYERAVELFSDVMFNATFPEKEIEKEKSVITDEINSYNDTPAELIFDDFENLLFKDHPLGRNILGTEQSIQNYTRNDVLNFVLKNYTIDNMVIASVGEIKFERLVKYVKKYFGNINIKSQHKHREPFKNYKPTVKVIEKNSFLSHLMIGNIAYSFRDKNKPAMVLLNNILGGPIMNSRLNMQIREKYGFAYQIESYYQPYSDTGVFSVYMGTDNKFIEKGKSLILKEMKKLRENKIGAMQLHRAKNQLIGQLAINYEQPLNEMLGIAKTHLYRKPVKDFKKNISIIENINSTELIQIANEILKEENMTVLTYESKK